MKNIETKIIKFTSTDNLELNGLLLGSGKTQDLFIFVHGLGSDCFKRNEICEALVDEDSSVLAFNNRGFGVINRFNKVDKTGQKIGRVIAGLAHEVFTDCVFDIEGAVNFAQELGFKSIYLIGHSTGCQKSIYYLSQKPKSSVKGVILLAPLSDYAVVRNTYEQDEYEKKLEYVINMIKSGKGQDLVPISVTDYTISAQRWLSLNTLESEEEIFAYASGKEPETLLKNKKPILVILARQDEYADRPVSEISKWFKDVLKKKDDSVKIISKSTHNFDSYSREIRDLIINWTE